MDKQLINSNNSSTPTCTSLGRPSSAMLEKKTRPQEQLNCPRCNSTNTKFCYYNNYSLTQPRYFCKTCSRYWTEGGSVRNVPVGGGSRKNKKSNILSSSSSSSSSSTTKVSSANLSSSSTSKILPDLNPPFLFSNHQNLKTQKDRDLNLSFPSMQEGGQGQFGNLTQYLQMPKTGINEPNPACSSLELLRTGIASRGVNENFTLAPMLEPNTTYSSSEFSFQQEYKPTLGFSIDGLGDRSGGSEVQETVTNGGRVFFPLGEMQQLIPNTSEAEDQDQHNIKRQNNSSNEFWNGMLSGGPSW